LPQKALTQQTTFLSIKPTKTKVMNKITISANLKEGTEITISDYRKLSREGEAIVEIHYNYDAVNKYDVMYYPESWENAQNALNGVAAAWVSKVIYHMPNFEENI
jgi:hypothetical protein